MKKTTYDLRAYLQEVFERAKLSIACRLNRLFPARFCWADCVAFSVSPTRVNPFKIDGCADCKAESIEKGACYCAQWHNGKTWSELSDLERMDIAAAVRYDAGPPF